VGQTDGQIAVSLNAPPLRRGVKMADKMQQYSRYMLERYGTFGLIPVFKHDGLRF